ncbi:MAG: VWA domain-containing protein [Parachlamydiaceae bacterium]|nr:VWA domain-containing protein [Parachlamydiaceae bacterium]
MSNFSFEIDFIALGLLLGFLLIAFQAKKYFSHFNPPYFFYSNVSDLKTDIKMGRSKWSSFPEKLNLLAFFFFSLAFIDPHLLIDRKPSFSQTSSEPPKEGIAIYLVLDQSGSMQQKISTKYIPIEKIQLLKNVTKKFISQRPSDLIGVVTFARVPNVLAPLTLDHETLQKNLDQLQVVKSKEEDGTAIGYAIYKTAHIMAATRYFSSNLKNNIKAPYDIKSAAMIVVTDGMQDPSILDKGNRFRTIELDEAAEYAKSQNIHLYIINIDPQFASDQYAPHRRQLKRITNLTGGKFYLINDGGDLEEIYSEINKLEKGVIQTNKPKITIPPERWSFYPFFIALGLLCFFIATVLNLTLLRKVP